MQHFVLEANANNTWKAGPGGRGFVQTVPRRRVCGGLTKVLRQRIKGGKNKPVRTIALHQPGWRVMSSNKALGAKVHRTLMHNLMCIPLKRCTCEPGAPRGSLDHFGSACQEAAVRFLRAHHLRPVAAEMIVLDKRLSIGTRFDAMFRNTITGNLVLVSWKTGVGCTNECDWKRAQTQVAWEWMTMEHWRRDGDESIAGAYVVYLGAATIKATRQRIGFYAENNVGRAQAEALYNELMKKLK